jgi:AraC-like DNA-binding protein
MPDLADTVIVVAVLQGAVLAVVLARRRTNVLANRILAALVAAVASMLLLGFLERQLAWRGHPHLLGFASPLPFLFGPLLFLYVSALTRPFAKVEGRWLVHALPFVADIVYMTLVFYAKSGDDKLALAEAHMTGRGGRPMQVVLGLQAVQAASYLFASFGELRRYSRKMRGYFSDLARIDLRWLTATVLSNAGVWSVVIVSDVVRATGFDSALLQGLTRAVQIGSALVIFFIGYVSVWQPDLFQKATAARVAEPPPASPAAPPKYQRNRLEDTEAAELATKLETLMIRDELFRDGGLTLQMLADPLGATPHMLSQVLNVRIGKSFFVFVNGYRAEALKAALADPAQAERGVLDLALAAGFNSKSTLNSFFKRHTGMTPTEYRRIAMRSAPSRRAKSANISAG